MGFGRKMVISFFRHANGGQVTEFICWKLGDFGENCNHGLTRINPDEIVNNTSHGASTDF
jgi:hypothetical protein